ncbi:M20/M25/M40 family metallo-hydrolase [Mumia sp. zg.B17]|uniref:M20/M25/M40 family metallo-hydrolase n=1 Tax=unclassified Mumia TaxID=2621872 RepID=UPI001C6EE708|nr:MULTISPECIES: M20/M25/M40 family metallo-hydrolase [unclassified Mumia]MBW9205114.1 M20/M25/M40 family metallo-hydrolase [Mumia sp. zg.B17]MBW9208882.1 M20/M25/M40 family metallo-hydrolase [Mumia sp. zg.B21]MDD9350245.1 M20/M25/M40 family metallo-hydrolase [Mumia sp.]
MTAGDQRETPVLDPAAEVVEICRNLIRIDTTNTGDNTGPGERKAAEYVAELLAEVGLESEIVELSPGRTNVLARWEGSDSTLPPLLVHGHLDVVPAQASDWSYDPFAGEIVDGYLYGRGAVDMKDFDAMVLSVVRARRRAGTPPRRTIVLAFTADEEAGSVHGAHKIVDHHADLVADCTEAIGEVGGFSTHIGGKRLYLLEAGEKGLAWMRLSAQGTAGHGSMVHDDNAVTAVARAVAAIGDHDWPYEPGPSMQALMAKVRDLTSATDASMEELLAEFGPAARMVRAGMRNISNPTMLEAGYKVNVIPGEAAAHVDGRFLPGQEEAFLAQVQALAGDAVRIDPVTVQPGLEYPFSGDLVDAMTVALHAEDPEAHVAPYLMSGGTDAKAWHRLGIRSYGFTPLRLPADLDFTALFHGVDERVPTDALEFGARVFDRLLDLA